MLEREQDIQRRVARLYRLCGCKVYPTSQYRISRQALGLPDLYVMHPFGGAWWHEVKAPGGKQSQAQKDFQAVCAHVAMSYVLGGYDEAQEYLAQVGIIADQRKLRA